MSEVRRTVVTPNVEMSRWPALSSATSGTSNEKIVVPESGVRFNVTLTSIPIIVSAAEIWSLPRNERDWTLSW